MYTSDMANGGTLRENKSIPVEPLGVLGVELHELVEENVGNRCHAPEKTIVSEGWIILVAVE
jgi:hypothetical protein